jgi:hypothetical protein
MGAGGEVKIGTKRGVAEGVASPRNIIFPLIRGRGLNPNPPCYATVFYSIFIIVIVY